MKPFVAALTSIIILSGPAAGLAVAPAVNPAISLAPVPALRYIYDSQRRDILPLYVSGLRASFSLETTKKTKVELTWLTPSGGQAQKTVKLAFPDKTGRAEVWDSIQFNAGQAPGPAAGWWVFEADFEGKKLSRRFLLTDSRQILTLASGDKRDRLEAVTNLDPVLPNIAEVVSIAFEDADADVREAALRAAAASSAARAWGREVLVRGTKDTSGAVRADAFGYLVGMGGAEGIKDAEAAAGDPSPAVRSKAAMVAPISDLAAEKVLAGLLKDPEPEVRELALRSARRQGGPASLRIMAMALGSADKAFRTSALGVVESMKAEERVPLLAPLLKDSDPAIRLRVLNSLISGSAPVEVVRPLVDDPRDIIAGDAFRYIILKQDNEGIRLASSSRHPDIKKSALRMLASRKDGEGYKNLEGALKDPDPENRREALNGLIRAGRAGVGGLILAASGNDEDIRREAISALSLSGPDEAMPVMTAALSDKDAAIRKKALSYIILKSPPGLAGTLGGLSGDTDPEVRSTALTKLLSMDGEESSRALSGWHKAAGPAEAQAIEDALSTRDDAFASSVMEASLKSADPSARLRAATYFLSRKQAGKLSVLVDDPDNRVRLFALGSLKGEGEGLGLVQLLTLAKDSDESIRMAALTLLSSEPGQEAGSALSLAMDDPSERVGRLAVELVLKRRDQTVAEGLMRVAERDGLVDPPAAVAALKGLPGEKIDGWFLGRLKILDAGKREEWMKTLSARGPGLTERAVEELLKNPDEASRELGMDRAKKLPEDYRKKIFASAITSRYDEVREFAVAGGKLAGQIEGGPYSLLADPSPAVRRQAFRVLSAGKDPGLADNLAQLVLDPDKELRRAVLDYAMKLPDAGQRARTLLSAAGGPDADIAMAAFGGLLADRAAVALPVFARYFKAGIKRWEIINAVEKMEGDAAGLFLADAYRAAADSSALRLIIVKAASGRGEITAPLVREALLSDPDVEIRLAALDLADRLSSPGREKMYAGALVDSNMEIKVRSLDGLSKAQGAAAVAGIAGAAVDPLLSEYALNALRARREPEAATGLAQSAPRIKDAPLRVAAVKQLAEKGYGTAWFAGMMDDPDVSVRQAVMQVLAERPGAEAVYGLLLAGSDEKTAGNGLGLDKRPAEELKAGIALLLKNGRQDTKNLHFAASSIIDPDALSYLIKSILAGGDARLMDAAVAPLVDRRAPADLPALNIALEGGSPAVKERVVVALSKMQGPQPEAALLNAYRAQPRLRADILRAAVEGGKADAFIPAGLADPDKSIRKQAAAGIGKLSAAKAKEAVKAAIRDPEEGVRVFAVSQGALKDEAVLKAALADPSPAVRLAAAKAIDASDGQAAANALGQLVRDTDKGVADEAASALDRAGSAVPAQVWLDMAKSKKTSRDMLAKALQALTLKKEPAAAGLFAAYIGGADSGLAEISTAGLKALGKSALPVVHPMLADKKLRRAALDLVSQAKDPSSEAPVLGVLGDLQGQELSKAIDILGETGGEKSLLRLAGLYKGGDDAMKLKVLKALGKLDVKGESPKLLEMLKDGLGSPPGSPLRFYAARATASKKVASLKQALEDDLKDEVSFLNKTELEGAVSAISAAR